MNTVVEGWGAVAGRPLFADLRLELETGRWTSLLGPSGVGKSTLLRLIADLSTGVEFHGEVRGRQPVALMAQDPGLLPWLDVTGNVLLGARLRGDTPDRARAAALIAQVGLGPHARKHPQELSGGQKQRAALARTLMEDRPLVLLDEPFSALDARMRAAMQTLAADLLRGRTVLMVTHDPAEAARLSNRIVLMTETGLRDQPVPEGATPRDPGDAGVLAAQTALLRQMMEGAGE